MGDARRSPKPPGQRRLVLICPGIMPTRMYRILRNSIASRYTSASPSPRLIPSLAQSERRICTFSIAKEIRKTGWLKGVKSFCSIWRCTVRPRTGTEIPRGTGRRICSLLAAVVGVYPRKTEPVATVQRRI